MKIILLTMIESPTEREYAAQLYETYGRLMRYVICQIVKDWEQADDLLQDAMCRLFPHLAKLMDWPEEHVRGYVCRTARSVVLNAVDAIYQSDNATLTFSQIIGYVGGFQDEEHANGMKTVTVNQREAQLFTAKAACAGGIIPTLLSKARLRRRTPSNMQVQSHTSPRTMKINKRSRKNENKKGNRRIPQYCGFNRPDRRK